MAKQLSLEQIIACDVTAETATEILPHINQSLATLPAIACWQDLTQHLLTPKHPFSLHELLYKTAFCDWDVTQEMPPAWFPTQMQAQSTNIVALMQALQLRTYSQLHTWSIENRAKFWDRMVQRLGIRLQQPYSQIVDLSQGVESPQWLVDARLNIVESCFQASATAPAIIFSSERQSRSKSLGMWTYQELHCLANRVAHGLVELGVQPGEAIAIDLPMTPESVAIYLGIVQAGCIVVSIADSFAPAEIAARLRIAHARAIFTQDVMHWGGKCLPLYHKVIAANAPLAIVLSECADPVVVRPEDLTWRNFLSQNDTFNAVPRSAMDPTNILFSSGTTGDPKAIPWTQTTPIKCAADGHLHHDLHPGDVLAWSTSLGWMMGPWLIYASLINRATIALYDGAPTTRGYGEFIQAARVTMLGVVPSLVNVWRTTYCMEGLDWSAIKAFSSTGECANPQDMLYLMSLAGYRPIVEYCGGTEIGGGYITGTLVQPCAPATFTTPALGLDVVLLDENGQPTDKGEAFIVPPAIGLSTTLLNQDHHHVYFADTPLWKGLPNDPSRGNLPAGAAASITPLRRHGDYLERLDNGYYRVCGRVDDTMNLGGIKVSSAEIERVLNQLEEIQETAAIAVSPPAGGPSQLVIYAVVRLGTELTSAALQTQCRQAIAQQLNPLFKVRDLVIVESLPRTASQKVLRRVLREHYNTIAVFWDGLECDRQH
ncbi:AMP-binding protein [Leptolyngbya sp. FACHB-671]|uniref:AMP-binding protein n=1 Tax=Leptolyngbya sp. FACHB-671 TaxID=2692812 RepID=UPI0016848F69|nr:AMP-binding protein [Leptolyngbya sp. FACHB-671]MBD2067204.1 AMP-binding protein [Leptolyngbya sp. FACHB-671]